MKNHHLAQVNIAQAKGDMESEMMNGFASRLDEINAIADQAPGFVWRLQTDAGDATSIRPTDDPMLLINLSVWDNLEALRNFVYTTLHVELIRDREAWFNKLSTAHQALWWVPAGHQPSEQESLAALQHLEQHGPSPQAFTFGKPFLAPK